MVNSGTTEQVLVIRFVIKVIHHLSKKYNSSIPITPSGEHYCEPSMSGRVIAISPLLPFVR